MLNRFILNPTATAVAEKISGVDRRSISSNLSLSPAVSKMVEYASTGLFPVTRSSTAQIDNAMTTAASELAMVANEVRTLPAALPVVMRESRPLRPVGRSVVVSVMTWLRWWHRSYSRQELRG